MGESAASEGLCPRCIRTGTFEPCCSSHGARLCHRCYRLTHFVEVCGCQKCDAEGLPRIYPERKAGMQ